MSMTRFVVLMSCVALIVIGSSVVSGQDFPNKPIRIVVDSPGGGTDFVARVIARGLTDSLGQQVIVENRGGAAGAIAIGFVAKAPPDGYTLLLWSNSMWTLPFFRKVPYDPVRDFSPVTLAVTSTNILVVHPSLPVKSVKELIALAKARPGELRYNSGGPGSTPHIAAELFKAASGVGFVNIPYKGAGPGMAALIAGEVQLGFPIGSAVAPHIKSGRIRALAVTSAQPSTLFPDLPTVAASGLPGYHTVIMYSIFAPAKTAATLINQLNREILGVLNSADVKERFFSNGTETIGSSPEQLAVTMKSEMARVGKVIEDAGIRAE